MNRIMRRTLAALGAGVLFITTLSGCGSSQATVKNGAFDAKQPIPASQAFKQKNIWYQRSQDRAERDANNNEITADHILVFDGEGKVTVYNNNRPFDDYIGKTDDQVIAMAKQSDKELAEKNMAEIPSFLQKATTPQSTVDSIKEEMASDEYQDYTDYQKQEVEEKLQEAEASLANDKATIAKAKTMLQDAKYIEPSPQTYDLSQFKDDSTDVEELKINYVDYYIDIASPEKWTSNSYPIQHSEYLKLTPLSVFQEGDVWYAGYSLLFTRVDKNSAGFILDPIKGANVSTE